MKTLQIQIPEGFKVESFDEQSGTVKFAPIPKDITERVKSVQDAIVELGESDEEVIELRKLQDAGITSHVLNHQEAVVLVKALNEGWIPDYTDSTQPKYEIIWDMNPSSGVGFSFFHYVFWDQVSGVCSRLVFKNTKILKYAANEFTDVFRKFQKH